MQQERVVAQEAKTQEDVRNALMQENPNAVKKQRPQKKEAKRKFTKSKAIKRNATDQG